MGMEMTVAVACKCRRVEQEAEKKLEEQRRHAQRVKELRKRCFGESALCECTFDRDDGKLPKISEAMRRYVERWDKMRAENLGILLHGPVGSGKTFFAACIANALLAQEKAAIVTNFATVVNELQSSFSGRQDTLDRLARVPLLVLDDLGIERESSYMQEQVYNIIDTRYRVRKPLIVTTNIPLDDIVHPKDLTYERIFDRVLEMCHPVKVNRPSRRREAVNENYENRKNLLGV